MTDSADEKCPIHNIKPNLIGERDGKPIFNCPECQEEIIQDPQAWLQRLKEESAEEVTSIKFQRDPRNN